MRHRRPIFCFPLVALGGMLLLLQFGTTVAAEADAPTLRVISYNVQFLPGPGRLFNNRGHDDYRAREIGRKMADFDIVGFNEVFDLVPRQQILDELKSAWGDKFHAVECPDDFEQTKRYNAGLAIASRYPIVETNSVSYSQSSTIKQFGVFADEFAKKGALHARIRIVSGTPNVEIDVFATHLDSKLASVRATQIDELTDFAAKHTDPSRAVLFMGDFNTRGNEEYQAKADSDYNRLVERLQKVRPSLSDLWVQIGKGPGGTSDQTKEGGGRRIDYIFFGPAETANVLIPLSMAVQPFLDPKVTALSDHSAVEATFELSSKPQ